jgi:hypothetical protein
LFTGCFDYCLWNTGTSHYVIHVPISGMTSLCSDNC